MATAVKIDIIGDNSDAVASFKDTAAAAGAMGKTIQGLGIGDVGQKMKNNVTDPIVAGFGAALNSAIAFESAQIDIEKSLGLSTQAALEMSNVFIDLAPDLGLMPGAMAAIATEGGKMGVAASEVDEFAEAIARSSVALDIAAEETGQKMAKITAAYGLPVDSISQLSADINALGDGIGGLNEDIIMSVGRASTMARIFGVTASETAAFSSVMNKQGIEAERIGTSLNRLFNTLSTVEFGTDKAKAALEAAGTSAEAFKASVGEKGAARATQQLLAQIAQMPDAAQQTKVLLDLFGRESADEIGALVTNFETMGKALDVAADKGANMNKFNDEFEKRSRSAAFQQAKFKSNLEGLSITIGRILIPALNGVMVVLNPIIKGLANFAEANPAIATVAVAIAGLAAVIGPLLILVGSAVTAWATLTPIVASAGAAIAGVGGSIAAAWTAFTPIVTAAGVAIAGVSAPALLIIGLMVALGATIGYVAANWDQFSADWMGGAKIIWDSTTNFVGGAMDFLWQSITQTFNFVADMGGRAIALSAEIGAGILSGLVDSTAPIRGLFGNLMDWIGSSLSGLASRAYQAGAAIIKSLIAGINSQFQGAITTLNNQLARLRSYLPSSDAKQGALSDISKSGTALMETFAKGIDAAPAMRSLNNALQQPSQQLATATPAASSGGGSRTGGNIVINYNPTVYGGTGGDGKGILEQLEQHSRQLLNLIDEARSRDTRADLP